MRLPRSLFYHFVDLFRTIKEKGIWVGLVKLGETLARIFYTRQEQTVLAKTLSESAIAAQLEPNLVVHQVKGKEELALMDSLANTVDAARFHRMFNNGSVAFIALHDGETIGWGWISDKIDRRTNPTQILLHSGDACLHDLFVAPAYRGRGIGQTLVARRLQFLFDQGYKRAVISCDKDNTPALKLAQKAGYTSIGEGCHTRFLFWEHIKYTPYD